MIYLLKCVKTDSIDLNRWTMPRHGWWQTKKWPTLTQTVSAELHRTKLTTLPHCLPHQLSCVFFTHQAGSWIQLWELSMVLNCTLVRDQLLLLHNFCAVPEAAISRSRSQSDPWISAIGLILNLLNMKFPLSIKMNLRAAPDKRWMIQAAVSGWGSLSHCLRAVQL